MRAGGGEGRGVSLTCWREISVDRVAIRNHLVTRNGYYKFCNHHLVITNFLSLLITIFVITAKPVFREIQYLNIPEIYVSLIGQMSLYHSFLIGHCSEKTPPDI